MKHSIAALLALAFVLGTLQESPRFAPQEDSSLTVVFEQASDSELVEEEVTVLINGEESEGFEPSGQAIERSFTERVCFTDEFASVEDGRALRVERVFDEITTTIVERFSGGEDEDTENEKLRDSTLQGVALVATWDEDEEAYAWSFAADEEDADEALLELLQFTGHLAELLPSEEVLEGDEWSVAPATFRTLLYPGGDLSYRDQDAEQEPTEEELEAEVDWEEQYSGNFDGQITLVYEGLRDEDAGEVLVISIVIEVDTSVETEAQIEVVINEAEGEGSQTETFTFSFSLEGELHWSPKLNRAVALQLGGETQLEIEQVQDMAGGGMEIEFTNTKLFEGESKYSYSFE